MSEGWEEGNINKLRMSSSPPSWSAANITDIKHLQQDISHPSQLTTKQPPLRCLPFLARPVLKIFSWFCRKNLSQTVGRSFSDLLISRGSFYRDHPTTFKYHHPHHPSHNLSSYEPPLETSFYAFYVSFPPHFYVRWSWAEEKYVKLF